MAVLLLICCRWCARLCLLFCFLACELFRQQSEIGKYVTNCSFRFCSCLFLSCLVFSVFLLFCCWLIAGLSLTAAPLRPCSGCFFHPFSLPIVFVSSAFLFHSPWLLYMVFFLSSFFLFCCLTVAQLSLLFPAGHVLLGQFFEISMFFASHVSPFILTHFRKAGSEVAMKMLQMNWTWKNMSSSLLFLLPFTPLRFWCPLPLTSPRSFFLSSSPVFLLCCLMVNPHLSLLLPALCWLVCPLRFGSTLFFLCLFLHFCLVWLLPLQCFEISMSFAPQFSSLLFFSFSFSLAPLVLFSSFVSFCFSPAWCDRLLHRLRSLSHILSGSFNPLRYYLVPFMFVTLLPFSSPPLPSCSVVSSFRFASALLGVITFFIGFVPFWGTRSSSNYSSKVPACLLSPLCLLLWQWRDRLLGIGLHWWVEGEGEERQRESVTTDSVEVDDVVVVFSFFHSSLLCLSCFSPHRHFLSIFLSPSLVTCVHWENRTEFYSDFSFSSRFLLLSAFVFPPSPLLFFYPSPTIHLLYLFLLVGVCRDNWTEFYSDFSFFTSIVMMWADTIIYMILAWYFDNVIPK